MAYSGYMQFDGSIGNSLPKIPGGKDVWQRMQGAMGDHGTTNPATGRWTPPTSGEGEFMGKKGVWRPDGSFAATIEPSSTSTPSTTPAGPNLMKTLFNTPVYQQNRLSQQQRGEMQGRLEDQFRRDTQRGDNALSRASTQIDNQNQYAQTGMDTGAALNMFDLFSGADRQMQSNRLSQLEFLSPIMQSLFGV